MIEKPSKSTKESFDSFHQPSIESTLQATSWNSYFFILSILYSYFVILADEYVTDDEIDEHVTIGDSPIKFPT